MRGRRMRKMALFLVLFFTAGLSLAYAHPPSDIKITFDPQTRILTAVIFHDVKDITKHFIKKVDVGLNGGEIINQSISQQDNDTSQTVSYLIPDAKAGDEISVEGYCSISGKLEKVLRI